MAKLFHPLLYRFAEQSDDTYCLIKGGVRQVETAITSFENPAENETEPVFLKWRNTCICYLIISVLVLIYHHSSLKIKQGQERSEKM